VRVKLNYITAVLAVEAAAAAPARPSPERFCAGAICESPGNVEIRNATPPVSYYRYEDMPNRLGGHDGLR
jgi:hypothetical protein